MTEPPTWPEIIDNLQRQLAAARNDPRARKELLWYRTRHNIDIDALVSTPETRLAFHAGMLYAQCQQECGTAPKLDAEDHEIAAALGVDLKAELAHLREQLGDAKTEWGVQRHGFMNRLFPKIAVDWMGSEAEARHEAANPTKPGTVVTRLVGEWRKVT